MTSDREIADGIMSAHYEFWDDPIEANRRSPKLEAIRDAIAAALASVRPKPTTSDKAAADGIVDEIAQKGVSLDDKQWDFAVGAIEAALASVREEEREACAKVAQAHAGSAGKRRREKHGKLARFSPDAQAEIEAEERGEDIASEIIARSIRSRQTPTGTGASRG